MLKNNIKILLLIFILSCNNEQTGQTFTIAKKDTFIIIKHDTIPFITHDTIIKVRRDTIIKEKHDTVIKIKTDTLPRFKLGDTAFFYERKDTTRIKIGNSTIIMVDVKD